MKKPIGEEKYVKIFDINNKSVFGEEKHVKIVEIIAPPNKPCQVQAA